MSKLVSNKENKILKANRLKLTPFPSKPKNFEFSKIKLTSVWLELDQSSEDGKARNELMLLYLKIR